MTKLNTLNEQLVANGQAVDLIQYLETGSTKLRLSIRSDSYRDQCYARIERWDGTKWQGVFSITPAAMRTDKGLVYLPNRGGVAKRHFEADITTLIDTAKHILGLVAR